MRRRMFFAGLGAVTTGQRLVGETQARKMQTFQRQRNEVGLNDIYAQTMPNGDAAHAGAAVADELRV